MKATLSAGAGYLVIDHSNSPGLPDQGMPEGSVLERDILQCTHCQRGVVLNPGRVRARAVCLKCHHYICDGCKAAQDAAGGACIPFRQVLDRAAVIAAQYAGQPDHPALAVLDDIGELSQPAAPTVTVPANLT